jgi:hypothetical protein
MPAPMMVSVTSEVALDDTVMTRAEIDKLLLQKEST